MRVISMRLQAWHGSMTAPPSSATVAIASSSVVTSAAAVVGDVSRLPLDSVSWHPFAHPFVQTYQHTGVLSHTLCEWGRWGELRGWEWACAVRLLALDTFRQLCYPAYLVMKKIFRRVINGFVSVFNSLYSISTYFCLSEYFMWLCLTADCGLRARNSPLANLNMYTRGYINHAFLFLYICIPFRSIEAMMT